MDNKILRLQVNYLSDNKYELQFSKRKMNRMKDAVLNVASFEIYAMLRDKGIIRDCVFRPFVALSTTTSSDPS